jgi:maltose/moltooligosaccharide transporter
MFIVLPEILASQGLGWLMKNVLNNNHMLAISLGGGFMLIAALLVQSLRQYDSSSSQPKEPATLRTSSC